MRLAVLVNMVPPYRVPLLEALAARTDELEIFSSRVSEDNRAWDPVGTSLTIRVQRTWTLSRTWRHPVGFHEPSYVHVSVDTGRLLRRFRPDVVLSGELGVRSLQAAVHARRACVPLVLWATLSERTEAGRDGVREALRRRLLNAADAVVVNGSSGERYVRARRGSAEGVFVVQQPAAPRRPAPPSTRPAGVTTLLAVGQLVDRKGLTQAFRALHLSGISGWELLVAGDGPQRRQLEDLASTLTLPVRFLGHLNADRLGELYARADFLLFPTQADEWGLVVNEALAQGVPVIGSRHSQAVEELVLDGVNGFTVVPEHLDQMAQVLREALATDVAERTRMRHNAAVSVQHLTADSAADRLLSVLEHAARTHRKDARR